MMLCKPEMELTYSVFCGDMVAVDLLNLSSLVRKITIYSRRSHTAQGLCVCVRVCVCVCGGGGGGVSKEGKICPPWKLLAPLKNAVFSPDS